MIFENLIVRLSCRTHHIPESSCREIRWDTILEAPFLLVRVHGPGKFKAFSQEEKLPLVLLISECCELHRAWDGQDISISVKEARDVTGENNCFLIGF